MNFCVICGTLLDVARKTNYNYQSDLSLCAKEDYAKVKVYSF